MASIIPTFECDIFISYRHNDDLDGWVTDFVQNLEKELKGTLKDSLTIYFDRNPHDGLLETHNVDRSLEGKLKCVIFIPIISQTYCDPKSFAWQHEFVAFNKVAKEDSFGREIKLSSGNVASRILPIKIHDIDAEDKTLLESELGGVLRAIEFIFKSSGVNRPLTSSDKREENSNKTYYRDQINKTANAIKELITAIKNPIAQPSTITSNQQPKTKSSKNRKPIFIALAALLIVASTYFTFQRQLTDIGQPELNKSIAVLPFTDMSPEHDQEYFGDGVSEEIINVLVQSEDLKVIARSSSFQFKGKNEDLKKIGELLGVANILEGSIRKSDDKIRISAQLINTGDGTHLWSKTFDRSIKDVFAVQDEIAKTVAEELKATFKEPVHSSNNENWNEEAKKEYLLGRYFFERRGEKDMELAMVHLKKSVELDSSKAIVYAFLFQASANNFSNNFGNYVKADSIYSPLIRKALDLDSNQPETVVFNANRLFSIEKDFAGAMAEMERCLKSSPRNPTVLRNAGRFFSVIGKNEEGIKLGKLAVEIDPMLTASYLFLAANLGSAGHFAEAIVNLKKAREINGLHYDMFPRYYVLNHESEKAIQENSKLNGRGHDFNEILIQYELKNYEKAALLFESYVKKNSTINPMSCVQLAAFTNKKELAFKWLEVCFRKYSSKREIVFIKSDPLLKSLHGDSRFQEFLKRAKFPEN